RDPKTPLRFAMLRVTLTAVLGVLFAFPLRPYIIDAIVLLHLPMPQLAEGTKLFGAIGLTASAGVAGWIEFLMLRRALTNRVGAVQLDRGFLARLWIAALAASAAALAFAKYVLPAFAPHLPFRHIAEAGFVAGMFGIIYFGIAVVAGVPEAKATLGRLRR